LRNRKDFRQFDFDILMANPPFAGDIKHSVIFQAWDQGGEHHPQGRQHG
jgi:hypothetical protein